MKKHSTLRKGSQVVYTALVLLGSVAAAQSATYPDTTPVGPVPAPNFPASFDVFNPPVHGDPVNAGAPAIAEWTRCNEPGDTMALTGSDLGSTFVYYTEQAIALGAVKHLQDMQAAVTVPSNLGSKEFCFLWNGNANGYSEPAIINGTEAWWLGPNKVARNETFSIFGQSLNLGGQCHAYIEGYGWLTSSSANPYKADFVVPSDLENGTYTIWAHNGLGGKYGWGDPQTFTVYDGMVWNDDPSSWFDVTEYGATGDGLTDDHQAIDDAVTAADKVAGSTVYFPAGTYVVGSELNLGTVTDVRIMGAGQNQTTLGIASGGIGSGELLDLSLVDSELCDMTLETAANSTTANMLLQLRGSKNALVSTIRLSQLPDILGKETVVSIFDANDSSLVKVYNCDFINARSAMFGNSPQIFVDGCNFYGINDANTILSSKASDGVCIQNSTAQNYDDSSDATGWGWGKGRFVYSNPRVGAPRNWYFGENTTTDFTPRSTGGVDQNSSEDFMLERCPIEYRAEPIAASATTVTFDELATSSGDGTTIYYIGYTATIVAGKGFGQSREIVDFDHGADTITVDKPWRVVPDSSSTVAIGLTAYQIICYKNAFDGMARPSLDETGEAGIEAYGGCTKLIADGNTFHEQESGMYVYSAGRDTAVDGVNTPTPNYFNVYKNNHADTCFHLSRVITSVPPGFESDEMDDYTAMFGNVFRNNSATNITEAVWNYETKSTAPLHDMSIFDRNRGADYGDDLNYYDYTTKKNSNTQPSTVVNQVVVDEYVEELGLLPPPPPPTEPPAAVLAGIEISGPASVDEGATAQYTCTASYSDGSTATVYPVWSENSGSATISSAGLVSAADVSADEACTISASFEGMTDTFDIVLKDVPVVLTAITISGPSVVDEESTAQYTCTASYSDGSTQQVTPTWSDNTSHATISASGLLTTGDVDADKTRSITATYEGLTDTHSVTIKYVPPVLTGITISGPLQINEETTAQYTCTASYSDGTSAVVTPTWNEGSSYASISTSGLLSAGNVASDESVLIVANFEGQSDAHAVTIKYVPPVLTGITVSGPARIDEETSAQYTCTASYSDGTSKVVTPAWSENSAQASISSSGLLSAGDVESDTFLTVTASYEGQSDTHAVVIEYVAPPVELTEITISGPGSLEENSTGQYVCTAHYSDGTSQQVTPVWSENSINASITASGLLSAGNIAGDSSVTVSASFEGESAGKVVSITAVGDQVVLPLSGFTGKTISAELWDQTAQEWISLGEAYGPEELVIENVTPNQWYWLGLSEYDESTGTWNLAHGRWIMR